MKKILAKPKSCTYICNRMVSKFSGQIMRRDVFQAIADPTRRAIIALIAFQAMTPNALAKHFDTSRQAVSKHLKILIECDLVTQEHQGREIYYQLKTDKINEIEKWVNKIREIWEGRFDQLDEVLSNLNINH